jgi:hypothetical protein
LDNLFFTIHWHVQNAVDYLQISRGKHIIDDCRLSAIRTFGKTSVLMTYSNRKKWQMIVVVVLKRILSLSS